MFSRKLLIIGAFCILLALAYATQELAAVPGLCFRGFLWFVLGAILGCTGVVYRFSYTQWFCLQTLLTYAIAPWAFTFVATVLPDDPATELTDRVLSGRPNEANDLLFTFAVVALSAIVLLFRPSADAKLPESNWENARTQRVLWISAALFLIGMIASVISRFKLFGPVVDQPLQLIVGLCSFSLALALMCYIRTGLCAAGLVLAAEFVFYSGYNFIAGGGHKGMIFNTALMLMLLFGSSLGFFRIKLVVAALTVGLALFLSLPVLNAYKLRASDPSLTLTERFSSLQDENHLKAAREELESTGGLIPFWVDYAMRRVTMLDMAHKYYEYAWGEPFDRRLHFIVLVQSLLPRVLTPNKIPSSVYYDFLARQAGIGNASDTETSYKPDLFCEAILIGSFELLIFVAFMYGCILVLMQKLVFYFSIGEELRIAIIFTTLQSVGQMPYLAALIAACLFWVPSYLLFCRFALEPLIAGPPLNAFNR